MADGPDGLRWSRIARCTCRVLCSGVKRGNVDYSQMEDGLMYGSWRGVVDYCPAVGVGDSLLQPP